MAAAGDDVGIDNRARDGRVKEVLIMVGEVLGVVGEVLRLVGEVLRVVGEALGRLA